MTGIGCNEVSSCALEKLLVALSEKELHSCIKSTSYNLEELVSVPNLSEGFGVAKCPTILKRPELSGPNVISSAKVMKSDIGVVNDDVFH